jgi:hypothetical protein
VLFLCNVADALFDLIWPSELYVRIPLIFKLCLVNSGWRRDVEFNRTDTSSNGIVIHCKTDLKKCNVLYKLPRFYNAYGTGGATMIFVHSKTLRLYPRWVHSRTFQLEGMFLKRLPWNLDLPNSRRLLTRMGLNIYISQIQREGMGRGAKFGTGWRGKLKEVWKRFIHCVSWLSETWGDLRCTSPKQYRANLKNVFLWGPTRYWELSIHGSWHVQYLKMCHK